MELRIKPISFQARIILDPSSNNGYLQYYPAKQIYSTPNKKGRILKTIFNYLAKKFVKFDVKVKMPS